MKIKSINWKNIKLPSVVNFNLYMVVEAMRDTNWLMTKYEDKTYKLIISNHDCQMAIYLSTMTVQTALNHPKQGRTQLTRRNITGKDLKRLLSNPCEHTGKGYHYKVN